MNDVLPADGDPWSGPVEILPGEPVPPPGRPRGRGFTLLVSGAVAAVALGGGAVAWAAFNGDVGDQPERHLPATAGAFVKVDLDPSGGQKIDALRFFRSFPAGAGLRNTDDPRRYVYEQLSKDDASAPAWSEVEPWLGQRMALAALPPDGAGSQATPVALLQVTDEAKAKATLAKAFRESDDTAFTVADGWATISDTRAHVDAVTRGAADRSLADDDRFRQDVDALGESGVAAAWADPSRFPSLGRELERGALAGGLAGAGLRQQDLLKQRYAMVARFSGSDAELVVRSFGTAGMSVPNGAGRVAAGLPAGTVAAVAVSGAGDTAAKAVAAAGDAVAQGLAQAQRESGLRLPDDLGPLLGRQFAIALAEPDGSGRPVLGVHVESDAAGLGPALDRLLRFTDASGLPLERRDVPGGYVLATDRTQAEAMTGGGDLGGSGGFRDAVPDADRASFVAYVDVQRLLASAYGKALGADVRQSLQPVRTVGVTMSPAGDGTTTTLRVTTR